MNQPYDSSAGTRSGYPIVDRWALSTADKTGWLGLGGRRRSEHEMAKLRPDDGHHVLVYRVDGDYLEDRAALGPRDDRLVRATHVSVVDMRRHAPVVVRFDIPSKDSKAFHVLVTFGCTVTDAVLVVRQGLIDPQQLLTSYVRSYHNALRMGLDFTLDEFTEVRRSVDDELTAYHAVTPPVIDGLEIQLAGIEVETPVEVTQVWDDLRRHGHDHRVKDSELRYREDIEARQARIEHQLAMQEEAYRQTRDQSQGGYQRHTERLTAEHEQDLAARREAAERTRREEEIDFRLRQYAKTVDVSQSAADRVMYQAYLDGKLDPNEMTTLLRQDRERQQVEAREDAERRHGEAVEAEKRQHEERLEHERYLRELEAKRADSDLARDVQLTGWDRADTVEERQRRWQLEDEARHAARDEQQRELDTRLRWLKEARDDEERRHRHTLEAEQQRHMSRLEWKRYLGELEGKRLDAELGSQQKRSEWEREDSLAERQDKLAERQHRWQQEEAQRQADHEAKARDFQARLRLLEELSKHGHLDLVNVNLEGAINSILTERNEALAAEPPAATAPATASLTGGEDPAPDAVDVHAVTVTMPDTQAADSSAGQDRADHA